ncbi:hypothetical protein [Dokdonella sp.]|uniref:DUF7716 domain-containing protein n=1 Tax=Dokdonella sp. TaxID=2291710 RepID=UPI0037847F8D
MTSGRSLALKDAVVHASDFPWNYSLYLPKDQPWNLTTPCLVRDPDAEDAELSDAANDLGFDYVLNMQQVQSIVRNAQKQLVRITDEDLLRALLYYYDNDAYITFRDADDGVRVDHP